MTFSNYLKGQLSDFVECYRKYFWRTFAAAVGYTILCFVVIALLLRFSDFDPSNGWRHISLVTYLFARYSYKEVYSLVDLAKSVFILFVAFFSIGISRLETSEPGDKKEMSFGSLIKQIRGGDIISLLGIFILSSILDYGIFRLDSISEIKMGNYELQKWLHALLFLLRIYVPMILFSIIFYKLTSVRDLKLSFKNIILLFISLWFFNEFAYEILLFLRSHVFRLFLMPFSEDNKYLYENFFGIALVAFYFLGYRSAMTTSLKQTEN